MKKKQAGILSGILLLILASSLSAQGLTFQRWRGPKTQDTITVGPGERLWRIQRQNLYFMTDVVVKFRGRTGANTFELEVLKTIRDPGILGRPLLDYDSSTRVYYISPHETLVIFPEHPPLTVSFQVVELKGSSLRFFVSAHPERIH